MALTLEELATALAPLADAAVSESNEVNVVKIGVVLSAILGAIKVLNSQPPVDQKAINVLACDVGMLCEYWIRRHDWPKGVRY